MSTTKRPTLLLFLFNLLHEWSLFWRDEFTHLRNEFSDLAIHLTQFVARTNRLFGLDRGLCAIERWTGGRESRTGEE